MLRTDRTYFVLLVGFLGAMGILDTAMLNPAIAAYASSLGADEFLSSFIAGLYSMVAIPASVVMGLTIDYVGRKRALTVGLGLTALWIYGYAMATVPVHLIMFRAAHAISGSLVFPASIAMIVDKAKGSIGRGIGRGIGLYWVVVGSALAIGSFLSAMLVVSLGVRSMFLLVAGVSLAGAVIALTLPETAGPRMMPRASLGNVASSMRWLSVAYLSIFSLYVAFGVIVGSFSLVLMLEGMSQEEAINRVGIYIALATVISLPIFYAAGRLVGKVGPIRILTLGIMFAAMSQLLLMVSLRPPYTYISSATLGLAIAFVFVASTAVAALPEARGASVGFHQTANIAGVALAAPLSGLLLKHVGILAPFTMAVAVQMVTLVIIMAAREATRPAELEILETHREPITRSSPKEES